MSSHPLRLPYDPELQAVLNGMSFTPTITLDDIPRVRKVTCPTASQALAGQAVEHEEHVIASPEGNLVVSIFSPSTASKADVEVPHTDKVLRPGMYYIHGCGMFTGSRFLGVQMVLDWIVKLGVNCVAIEYRLPPEHPYPAPMSTHATELGIDPDNISIASTSAGGGLAAGTALLARDRGGPALRAQILECPMLDDRNNTFSAKQFATGGTWSQGSNATGWSCLLGGKGNEDDVSICAAPSRATDLSRLPPTFISAFAYASTLWKSGVQAEVHVWAGGFHGFMELAPTTAVSIASREARTAWVQRTLCSNINT
ncbi:alpha/beta-hydrolase [Mytilinidion resinicola]|uniref:Alpha/beta-hydrolase n=1 Tax=Mytilinidion resinicola TaxID=574789 RepID=A0A6A6YD27_9PEZI|nr:alpha/beta-hydrolase [Mytilinidion resinicola]KAF2806499.1 alpha/beta-hydrolase [Mytilinidion resinicola]